MCAMKPEKFQIVAVGRMQSRECRGRHENYPTIYEVYVEEVKTRRVRVSGFLWWSKYTLKTETRWKYIGYHLSHNCAMTEIVYKRKEARKGGKVVDEFVL